LGSHDVNHAFHRAMVPTVKMRIAGPHCCRKLERVCPVERNRIRTRGNLQLGWWTLTCRSWPDIVSVRTSSSPYYGCANGYRQLVGLISVIDQLDMNNVRLPCWSCRRV